MDLYVMECYIEQQVKLGVLFIIAMMAWMKINV